MEGFFYVQQTILALNCSMKYLLPALAIFLFSCGNNAEKQAKVPSVTANNTAVGESLFKINCSLCHKPNEEFTGPALKDVAGRWPGKETLYDFVKNSQEVISRNAYAKQLFEKYNQSPMPPFPQLKDEEIEAILNYCNK